MSLAVRNQVQRLEAAMRELPQVELDTRHTFANGMYAREMRIPAGVCLVGKIHRHEHLFLVTQGMLRVTTDEGIRDIEAPAVLVGAAGTKRAGFALTDVVCVNVHRTDLTDLALIEAEQIEPESAALFGPDNKLLEAVWLG
jgi:hypothetical protein